MRDLIFSAPFLIRRNIYKILNAIDGVLGREANIFILCYHGISVTDNWRFSISFTELKEQISYLEKMYKFLTLSDLEKYLKGDKRILSPSVIITFDDGYKDLNVTKNYFKGKNITPALFLLSDKKNANRKELDNSKKFLSKNEILSLHDAGWEIGCHSATHSNLATLPSNKLIYEIVDSKKSLEKDLGIRIKYFAYPRGKYNTQVINTISKAGYKLALTMDDSKINLYSDKYMIPRIGVDRTHTLSEFKTIFSPSVVQARKIIKSTFL